jgi:hypothetical protein
LFDRYGGMGMIAVTMSAPASTMNGSKGMKVGAKSGGKADSRAPVRWRLNACVMGVQVATFCNSLGWGIASKMAGHSPTSK